MHIKSYKWLDIHAQIKHPLISELNFDYLGIQAELGFFLGRFVNEHETVVFARKFQNNKFLASGTNSNLSPRLFKLLKADMKKQVIEKTIIPFIQAYITDMKEEHLGPVTETLYKHLQEAYLIDSHLFSELNLSQQSLYTALRLAQKEMFNDLKAGAYYSSHLSSCLDYWKENQHLFELQNKAPSSDKFRSGLMTHMGLASKAQTLNLEEINQLNEIVGLEPMSLEEYQEGQAQIQAEKDQIDTDRRTYLKIA